MSTEAVSTISMVKNLVLVATHLINAYVHGLKYEVYRTNTSFSFPQSGQSP